MAEPQPDVAPEHTTNGLANFSLENILNDKHDTIEHPTAMGDVATGPAEGWDEEDVDKPPVEGYCIECEDQPAQVLCENCTDAYCEVCFAAQHRKGTRKRHAARPLGQEKQNKKAKANNGTAVPRSSSSAVSATQFLLGTNKSNGTTTNTSTTVSGTSTPATSVGPDVDDNLMKVDEQAEGSGDEDAEGELDSLSEGWQRIVGKHTTNGQPAVGAKIGEWFVDRAKFIPLRLTLGERKYLRLLEAALSVSEYTDKIDTIGFGLSKAKRIVHQIRELCAIMSGLVLAADYKQGQELFQDKDFESNSEFYQQIFELGRRHKIMNPEKMRTTYGKLIYLLQDSQSSDVKDLLNFSCVRPIKTVHLVLEEHDAVDLLRDDLVTVATKEIYSEGRSRREVQKDIKAKERAIETLSSKYARNGLTQEKVRQCLYSIGDNHAFLRVNRDPCDQMIVLLKQHFHPTQAKDQKSSLAIRSGRNGARLSHDHSKQYAYVLQSLTLWREILHDMFHLWSLAEQDLLSENVPYRLRDTGQGLNRVQAAPKTSRMMHNILHKAQTSVGTWIGSSVIHMGDHNVPNALMFIDKYTQIYRILLPICNTLRQIPLLAEKPALRSYIDDEFGSVDNLVRDILGDFFRHGFDGSGADNFFDAGSCIDGRLTSAWNWCSSLEKKRYFHVFLLTGFVGFDGEW
ncbi:hypothetical protein AGABI2DRAFT_211866 [Agaricus bisporus var. bisporus H97]|uniref:hypothetical protein n=1 Tax=Agaricus bisporus var. bisporus (strain H97 / ATCC MYA-4626 / FGSC 10389) TaxID=936046 RepID=UPI00029F5FFC|nr:hypothetical protein AGABI2DRAFT_211866 [Agaricus bisporus var. bisporus H97]EKV42428.1 hypothetical protein AGABI2DRAFT_211866 [Agaricus bisporus var. bisporus H97]